MDWFEWGIEAFGEAKRRDVPIFLSIGYSACHWCHVMAHESFEDDIIAERMNELFVNIKVDREERPDVDSVYMSAVQAMTGRGGWPMSVWLTPDQKPLVAGTYFPKEPRHGMRSFPDLNEAIGEAWAHDRESFAGQGDKLISAMHRDFPVSQSGPTELVLKGAYEQIISTYDATFGGFGGAPKFPQQPVLDFLLTISDRPWATEAKPILDHTLTTMAAGGIYDHLGGGFARYSVDRKWLIPHFEKMLYDNAQLIRLYLRAGQNGGPAFFTGVAEVTIEYVMRDLLLEGGGFASAEDADSEGEEGKFYVWTDEDFRSIVGPDDADAAALVWGVSVGGNFEGSNNLHAALPPSEVARLIDSTPEKVRASVNRARQKLLKVRSGRVRPGLDDKVVTAWNGLMLRALAEAGAVLDRAEYLESARNNARFVLANARTETGSLARSWAKGRATTGAFLEDYAGYAMGLFRLYQATGEFEWYEAAETLTREIPRRFLEDGRFYANDNHELIIRPQDQTDNPQPSGSSLAAEALLTLALYTGESELFDHADTAMRGAVDLMERAPSAVGHMLTVAASLIEAKEVAIVGPDAHQLASAIWEGYYPNVVLATSLDGSEPIPLLRGRADGTTRAFVCENFICEQPVTSQAALSDLLGTL